MRRVIHRGEKGRRDIKKPSTSLLATNVPTYTINFHTDNSNPESEKRYVPNMTPALPPTNHFEISLDPGEPSLPFAGASSIPEEAAGAVPAYETTSSCHEHDEKKTRQNVAHMEELKAEEPVFLATLLSLYHHSQLLAACSCGTGRLRTVKCDDCMQSQLLCRQCWLNKHRTMPTHWALIWNEEEQFFEKHDFCRVMPLALIGLGHYGERCPDATLGHSFTLVDSNGIHATAISFCRCKTVNKVRAEPEFQQLLRAGIFPGSVKEPKTGYTLGLLEYYRQLRSQGKGSAYNFVLVLQRMSDPFFADSVPDIYVNFLAITRFHQNLDIRLRRGFGHGLDEPLPGETERPYPNRPEGFQGLVCGACPERGVNMPLDVTVPKYLRHLIALFLTLDGNFKANLFYKRDDGSDIALTDGNMYFPLQKEFEELADKFVVSEQDKEVPCKAHIGSIRHQGQVKYGNTAVSGVVACACDHAVAGSFVDMLKGEAFAIGTYAQRECLQHTNSPPHGPLSTTPTVFSYDSWCSFVVGLVARAELLFPEEKWLHTLLASVEGQIPADHINGHGPDCQARWQAVYFACRAHFHGETAEVIWAFLNALGSSTRQMTGAARHDTMNFVIDAWNTSKLYRQAELLAAERLDALRLFELHMAVVEDLSRQHATDVARWSALSRTCTKSPSGKVTSVYQHNSTSVLTIENVLASMIAEEREKLARTDGEEADTPVAQWIHDGMSVEREQVLVVALLRSHHEHPLQETWAAITKLRDTLNIDLKKFRERQLAIYPRLKLSALDVDEPELTAVQLPSYRIKHGQRSVTGLGDDRAEHFHLQEAEVKLRCSEANAGILAVQAASLALSAVKKARDLDYRGQAGITRSQRNLQKAELMKTYEITMYNRARAALINLGHMSPDATEPYPPLTHRDTRRKETHLHRVKGDSRLFDGTAWYLQSGVSLSRASKLLMSPVKARSTKEDAPTLLAGTQTLKRSGSARSPRPSKRLKDIAPDGVIVEPILLSEAEESDTGVSTSTPAKGKHGKGKTNTDTKKAVKRSDGWIWLENITRGQKLGAAKLEEYKRESDQVQWLRAEAEMYRWLEQYERKHAELWRLIMRFRRDRAVWVGRAGGEEHRSGVNGSSTFAMMQAAMFKRLEHNATVTFKSPESGAHHDWVSGLTDDEVPSFDELVVKIDEWRNVVFRWMDDMGVERAYKKF